MIHPKKFARDFDYTLGLLVALLVTNLNGQFSAIDHQGIIILLGEMGLGLLCILFTTIMTLGVIGLFDKPYLFVLDASTSDGIVDVAIPFRITGWTSFATVLVGGISILIHLVTTDILIDGLFLWTSTFLAVWSLWGTRKLLSQILEHAMQRAKLSLVVAKESGEYRKFEK